MRLGLRFKSCVIVFFLFVLSIITTTTLLGGFFGAILITNLLLITGPLGFLAGFLGSSIGSIIVESLVGASIEKPLNEEGKKEVISIIENQLIWLSMTFKLTDLEIENLNQNIKQRIDQKSLELIFNTKKEHQRSMANLILKPTVVAIISQRPANFDKFFISN